MTASRRWEWIQFGALRCCGEGVTIYWITLFGHWMSIKLPMRGKCSARK